MVHTRAPLLSSAVLTVAAVLIGNIVGCGSQTVTTLYTVGGTVTGLNGTLKLANKGADTLTITATGAFKFATGLKAKAAYDVTVAEAPAGQVCTVSDGQGTIGTANVSNVTVTCSTGAYTLGGTVSGLAGDLVLGNSSASVTLAAGATTFVFADPLADGAPYHITVKTQPSGQRCDVTGGSGTVSGANVNSVVVSCAATHALKVHVTGMTGVNMQMSNNANDLLDITFDETNSSHTYDETFATGFVAGDTYTVTVAVQPQNKSNGNQSNYCTPQTSTGTVGSVDTVVSIACVQAVLLQVNVLRGSGSTTVVELSDGRSDDIMSSDNQNVAGTFEQSYPDGATYRVHLAQGTGCTPCPLGTQAVADTVDITGTFAGDDATANYVCDGRTCSEI